jgi:hypothetical protein
VSNKNTGGPAFPQHQGYAQLPDGAPWFEGLTMRDYFAGVGLNGMLSDSNISGTPSEFAIRAYALADAMLKAREQ